MARQAWQRTITDAAGNVLTGVQITVFQENGVTLATIYGQQTGGAALANPFSTGLQTSAKFYADPGRYVVRAFKDGLTQEFTDVDIGGKSVREDLGSAAYLTATTSTTDPTQGRAMRSGDYGIGATGNTGIYSGDISSIASTGIYSGGPATTGGPAGVSLDGAKIVHLKWADPNSSTQIVYTYAGPSYSRNITGGVPLAWRQDYNTANALGAVAFSGGVNAGAVLEYGTNSNGSFLKLADGTVFAWGRVIQTGITLNPAKSTNSNTAYVCSPVAPTTMLDITLTICQRAIYDATNDLIYSTMASSTNGNHIILNLGMKPSGFWPNLDTLGNVVATKVDYYWSAIGRWR